MEYADRALNSLRCDACKIGPRHSLSLTKKKKKNERDEASFIELPSFTVARVDANRMMCVAMLTLSTSAIYATLFSLLRWALKSNVLYSKSSLVELKGATMWKRAYCFIFDQIVLHSMWARHIDAFDFFLFQTALICMMSRVHIFDRGLQRAAMIKNYRFCFLSRHFFQSPASYCQCEHHHINALVTTRFCSNSRLPIDKNARKSIKYGKKT